MTGGYEVALASIGAASGAAKRASADVRKVDLAATLAGVATGLPGGVSGEAARLLADAWSRAVPDWAQNTADYAERLDEAAARYRANELAASRELPV
ncbi:hypothetical protein [Amycolatopsis sp. CB00013]|uniref:hypothetical protein n=1 Tax=Amycolatopsis sp. CB00013 TaxID=1703945 RepID=UPI00093C56EA|nr:hypothetical protein [Amycolatopsis sp. CB00013]OKJ95749.1 hypothetical protein AMK34_22410 [Amycolatopsis sp. CB00013]